MKFPEDEEDQKHQLGRVIPEPWGDAWNILRLLRDRNHSMKELKLNFEFRYPWETPRDEEGVHHEWIPDVSAFCALGSAFERVEFTIIAPVIWDVNLDEVTLFYQFYLKLQVKLEELAMSLIGVKEGDGLGWIVRDRQTNTGKVIQWSVEAHRRDGDQGKREVQGGLQCFKLLTDTSPAYVMIREPENAVRDGALNDDTPSGKGSSMRLRIDGKIFKVRPRTPRAPRKYGLR